MLQPGDSMPQMSVTDDSGASVDTAGFLGKPLVLWFYPKDDTPG